jgi:DNA-binding response OmpR family regulator
MKMRDELWALVVYSEEEPVAQMERMLIDLGISTQRAHTHFDADAMLRMSLRPSFVVTDASLPDGTWLDVLYAARADPIKVPVIVVSRLVDMQLYLDALDSGAHDFVVPPFTIAELTFIIRTAIREDSRNGCSAPLLARDTHANSWG